MKKNSFETQILHTPFEKEDAYHSLSMPVYHTAAYEFRVIDLSNTDLAVSYK